MDGNGDIGRRKRDHIDAVMNGPAPARRSYPGWDALSFEHCALPEMALADVDLRTRFLGREIAAPLLISSMTGGPERAEAINAHLAEAAEAARIAFAVGSQRIALEQGGSAGLGRALRRRAPSVPLLANFGAAQLNTGYGVDEARRAVDMIEADGLIVHLNPLQEAVQPGGDGDWSGLLAKIAALVPALGAPLVVKEVGCGLSPRIVRALSEAGVAAIDVAGAGGTSWAWVEAQRARDAQERAVAEVFADWGIPAAEALRGARAACPDAVLIGSGGVRSGLDAAKAIRLGADLVGQAANLLGPAVESAEAAHAALAVQIRQLRIACFVTGSRTLADLRRAPAVWAAEPRSPLPPL